MHKRIYISFLLLSTLILSVNAQNFKHPYSIYGIGIEEDGVFSSHQSMGGVSLGSNERFSFTPANPASYSSLQFTTFEFGLNSSFNNFRQNDVSLYKSYANLSYFALGFPIYKKKGIGGSFGLLPVSNIGYTDLFSYIDPVDSVTVNESIRLSGGFSKFYIGTAFTLFKTIKLGVNAYYLFGNTEKYHSLDFISTQYNSVRQEDYNSYGKIGFDLGLQGYFKLSDEYQLTLAGTFSPGVNLNATSNSVIQTYEAEGSTFKDSVRITDDLNYNVALPMKYGAGFMFSKMNKWRFGVDYKFEQWSTFTGLNGTFTHNDQWIINAGGEYIPKFDDPGSYANRIAYRAGIKYAKSNAMPNGSDLQMMSISLGVGLPMIRSISKIDAGLELGTFGKNEGNLIQQNFIKLNIGLRLTEFWFIKSKID